MVDDYTRRTMARLDNAVIPLFSSVTLAPSGTATTDAIPSHRLRYGTLYIDNSAVGGVLNASIQASPDGTNWFPLNNGAMGTDTDFAINPEALTAFYFMFACRYLRIVFYVEDDAGASSVFSAWLELLE